MREESEWVVKVAAQLIKNTIKQFELGTESHPTVDDINSPENELVPELLKVFIKELFKSVPEFIQDERTNIWESHVATTKFMLILFAATGHNNYAKTVSTWKSYY